MVHQICLFESDTYRADAAEEEKSHWRVLLPRYATGARGNERDNTHETASAARSCGNTNLTT
jgi:hypothetical protein